MLRLQAAAESLGGLFDLQEHRRGRRDLAGRVGREPRGARSQLAGELPQGPPGERDSVLDAASDVTGRALSGLGDECRGSLGQWGVGDAGYLEHIFGDRTGRIGERRPGDALGVHQATAFEGGQDALDSPLFHGVVGGDLKVAELQHSTSIVIGYDNRMQPVQTPSLARVLASAARLQQLVPDAVLVGGTAVAIHVGHRLFDDDHVLADLVERFDTVLEALEREGDWVTNRVAHGKIILGELGGIETGLRQLIRARPLETELFELPGGQIITVPTVDECARIKAFLIVKRNQVRDYLDVAAIADKYGIDHTAAVLARIDDYYADQAPQDGTVAGQVAAQLAAPQPRDARTTARLADYKGLSSRWHDWNQVITVCRQLADAMLTGQS